MFSSKSTAKRLDECISLIQDGGYTLEQALVRFPAHAVELRPLLEAELEIVQWLNNLGTSAAPSPEFLSETRRQLLQELEGGREKWYQNMLYRLSGRLAGLTIVYTRPQLAGLFALAVALLATLWFSMGVASHAARTSLPGEYYYPLKIAAEEVRLLFTWDYATRAALHTEFANQRLMELQALVFEGRFEAIPPTVAHYEQHLAAAIEALAMVAEMDATQARMLADLHRKATRIQIDLVLLLVGSTPDVARSQLEYVGFISQQGNAKLQDMLPTNGG